MGQTNWINVSGGKDSTALLLWTLEEQLPNCRYVYADTQHEHPLLYDYLDYLEHKTGVKIERVETEGFLNLCVRKGRFPSPTTRFCTEFLKIKPMAYFMDQQEESDADNPHMVYVGIRAEESPARASLPASIFSNVQYPPRKISYQLRHHPILDWYVQDVFDMMKKHDVEPNPLYKMGMHRVGCFPCILARRSELRTMFKAFPQVVDKLRTWEELVGSASKRGESSFFRHKDLPEGVTGGIDTYAAYLDRGDELPGLEQDYGGCMSVYGLCE